MQSPILNSPFSDKVAFNYLPVLGNGFSTFRGEARGRHSEAGRCAAKQALEKIGIASVPVIGSGSAREPLWPTGIVGSISHCDGLAAAAAAYETDVQGLGLDLELRDRQMPVGVINKICSASELAWLGSLSGERRLDALLVFSAKECIYKCFFPKFRVFLGFSDAVLTPVQGQGFAFELRKELPQPVDTSSCLIKATYFEQYLITALEWKR